MSENRQELTIIGGGIMGLLLYGLLRLQVYQKYHHPGEINCR